MSEKIIRVLLSELKKIRIVCKNPRCGVVQECPIERLPMVKPACPACGSIHNANSSLDGLSQAVDFFTKHSQAVDIEFIIPDVD